MMYITNNQYNPPPIVSAVQIFGSVYSKKI